MVASASDLTGLSPWERYHGRKIGYKKNLKAGFGEYCQAHDNNTDNTMKARTTGAFIVYDTGKNEGSWYTYNLNTDRLIRRNKFTILPMPDVVIDFLNNMHDAEEKGEQVDLTFEIGFDRDVHFDKYHQHMYKSAERYITIGRSDNVYDPAINLPVSKQNVIVDNSENIIPLPEEIESVSIQGVQVDETDNLSANDADTIPPDPDPGVESDSIVPPRRGGLRPGRVGQGTYTRKKYGKHLSAKQAVEKLGKKAKLALVKEK